MDNCLPRPATTSRGPARATLLLTIRVGTEIVPSRVRAAAVAGDGVMPPDAAQEPVELHCNSTRRRAAPMWRRDQRYLNPITALHLRLRFLVRPNESDTAIAKAFAVSRPTVVNHTRKQGLDRRKPFAGNLALLRDLWGEECKEVGLLPEDFVPVYMGVLARSDGVWCQALRSEFRKAIESAAEALGQSKTNEIGPVPPRPPGCVSEQVR
jgi:hypothetical protein